MQLNTMKWFDVLPVQTHTGFHCSKKILVMVDSGIMVLSLTGDPRNLTENILLTRL